MNAERMMYYSMKIEIKSQENPEETKTLFSEDDYQAAITHAKNYIEQLRADNHNMEEKLSQLTDKYQAACESNRKLQELVNKLNAERKVPVTDTADDVDDINEDPCEDCEERDTCFADIVVDEDTAAVIDDLSDTVSELTGAVGAYKNMFQDLLSYIFYTIIHQSGEEGQK